MQWRFDDASPIYQQIMGKIKTAVAVGDWKAGDKLPSVRELAMDAGVNPNTMQKALAELEREGLLYSQRTAGRFVSDNVQKTNGLQEELMEDYIKVFLKDMKKLGYQPEEVPRLLEDYLRYRNRENVNE